MSNYSDFWLKDNDYDWDWEDELDNAINEDDGSDVEANASEYLSENTTRLIRLSSARRAVANYVSILTGQNVPVLFNNNAVNCTDGKTVYISADITKKNKFDVAVGLALHEGSHIKYSDFDLFKNVWMYVPRSIYNYTEKLQISKEEVGKVCQQILNYVEDRYIDYTVHSNAPGYRGYYDSLYDEYFNSKVITDGLKSDLYRTLSVDSYLYRIINLTNADTSLNALPGLYDIAKEINLSNINRLSHPKDRLEVAYNVAEIVFKNITEYSDKKQSGSEVTAVQVSEDGNGESTTVGTTPTSLDDILGGQESAVNVDNSDVITNIGKDDKISKNKLTKIGKMFEKQKDFLNGKLKKKKVSKRDKDLLDVLEKSKIDLVPVATDVLKETGIIGNVECILIKNMTREFVMSDQCPMSTGPNNTMLIKDNQKNIDEGIVLGTKLGRRLQIRNEINIDKFSRRTLGKIDKRLMHELGFETESNIFYNTIVSKYKKVNFHISVDASSSMGGNKWRRTMKLCVALAKATSMIDNVNLTISFRSNISYNPYILIGYDSRVDKFSKIKNLFPYLIPTATTPEGLCFEALMKYLPKANAESNSYFVNISDGEPCFNYHNTAAGYSLSYTGNLACNHTKKQVNKIRDAGYNVISYFVTEYDCLPESRNNFKTMYGVDAKFINIGNVNEIVKTINSKMMEAIDI